MIPRFNMHVHTWRSACAKPEMVLEDIDREAVSAGLRYVGLSDHIDRFEDNERPALNRTDLLEGEWDVEFLVGCEATVLSPDHMAVTDDVARGLDYVMVSANHYHLSSVENPRQRNGPAYAAHYLKMLEGILNWGLADIVAHPFLHSKIGKIMDPLDVLEYYDWDGMEGLITKAGENGLSFEIKPGYGEAAPEFFSELVLVCRRHGVRFSLGADSHRLAEVAYPSGFPEELDKIGVRQSDLIDPRDYLNSR